MRYDKQAMLPASDRGMLVGSRRTFTAPGFARPMIDGLEEPARLREAFQEADSRQTDSGGSTVEQVEPLSFAARARAILLLSLLCWVTLLAALFWLMG